MEEKKLTRRAVLRASVVAMAGVSLAACQPKLVEVTKVVEKVVKETVVVQQVVKETVVVQQVVTPTAGLKAPVTITLISGWGGETIWNPIINLFQDENPSIKVEWTDQWASPEMLMTTLASGNVYDLMHGDTMDLYAKGVMLQLDDAIDGSAKLNRDDFKPELWELHMWEGKTYAVPVLEDGANPAFSWNATLLAKEGVDVGDGPKGWDEVANLCKKVNKFDAAGNLTQLGLDPLDGWGITTAAWTMGFDAPIASPDFRTVLIDQDNWVAGLDIIGGIYRDADMKKVMALRQQYPTWTGAKECGFPSGKRLMIINGQWQPGELKKSIADPSWKIGYGWLPCLNVGKKYINFGQSHGMPIAKASRAPREAFAFLEHMTSIEINELTFKIRGGWIPRKGLNLDFSLFPDLKWFSESIDKADEIFSPNMTTRNPVFGQIEAAFRRAVEEVAYGRKEAEQALQDARAEAQSAADDFWAKEDAR